MSEWTTGAVNLQRTDISGSKFQEVNAQRLYFDDVSLAGTQINNADLRDLKLDDVNMTGAKITNGNLSDIIIENVQFTGAQFRNIDWPIESMDSNYNAEQTYKPVVFENCKLKNSIITKCDLSNISITDCDITGLTINGIAIDELLKNVGISSKQQQPRIKNALQVRLVSNLAEAHQYYRDILGFSVDDWGHVEREGVGFILQQAESLDDIRPNAKPTKQNFPYDWPGPPATWDTYAYSNFDGVQQLYEEFVSKGAVIAYEPQIEDVGNHKWKEFAVRDLDGYVIVFGGSN
ncbi:pentapeptide repeat-containing protein [Paenibacillus eucommiae]|uniref:Catechol 2,3-dioxygenase-like lactoylglutathione lyase family enzyme n=1 Tax=Paenibacillus eucommiae TaxID=1355755 RepID=A0ABS4IXL1_9BACL|nr:pentapeptide repeat-containing protein [Paenibacillus eucommiae]MBP1992248.1 catechol 2,3-dioxygenase-like lactoylglutathione lyase family enzyme [Paenibacillus eucommiae]